MRLITTALSLALIGVGGHVAGGSPAAEDDDARLLVATTVAPITNIVANIAGDRADVEGIVPEGTNSHTFEPQPSVAELLSTADVIYLNGLQLEEPTRELAEANLSDGRRDRRPGRADDLRGRVRLRLLVPGGRRQAQPAPVDQPADGAALRRDRPRRPGRPRSRTTPTTTPPTTTPSPS